MPLRSRTHLLLFCIFALKAEQYLVQSTIPASLVQVPNGEGCGRLKTCFFQPNGCWQASGSFFNTSTCVVGATITPNPGNTNATVELMSFVGDMDGVDITKYGIFVAMGLSTDKWMGDDSVATCVWSPEARVTGTPRLSLNYNTGHYHGGDYTKFALNHESGVDDGMFWCRFTRDIVATGDNSEYVYPLDQSYYYLLTRGVADATTQTPHIHALSDSVNFPFISNDKILSVDPSGGFVDASGDHGWASTISREMQYKLVNAHGSLMMLGFWVFLGTGILLGRYYKVFFPGEPTLGKVAAWFQLHRSINITGVILVIASFVCIFVSTGHLLDKATGSSWMHMIVGMTAVILVVLLPISAIFRPHPGTPYRPLFKDFHFFFAFSAMALSSGAFILAAKDLQKGGLTDDPSCLTYMYAVVGILGLVNIFQTLYMRIYQAQLMINTKEKTDVERKYEQLEESKSNGCLRPIAMPLHLLTLIYFVSVLVITGLLINTLASNSAPTLGEMFS